LAGSAPWAQGDVAEQGAQQPFAVPFGGARCRPQPGQLAYRRGKRAWCWQGYLGVAGGGQGRFGVGEFDQACFPPGFQAAGPETILRFAGCVSACGSLRGVAGAFDRYLDGAQRAGSAVGDLAGGGQGQRELFGGDRGEQRGGDRVVDGGGAYRATVGGGYVVGAGSGAFVVGLPAGVAGTHRPSTRTTDHD